MDRQHSLVHVLLVYNYNVKYFTAFLSNENIKKPFLLQCWEPAMIFLAGRLIISMWLGAEG